MILDLNQLAECDQFNTINDSAANILLAELQVRGHFGDVRIAIRDLLQCIRSSIGSLHFLFRNNPNDAERDGTTILRTIYDAHLQALYILKNPSARAKLYKDFYWIEWHKFVTMIDSQPGQLFKLIAASKNRPKVEPENRAKFQEVQATYLSGSNSHRSNWYQGSLATVAADVGYEGEYRVLSRLLNPCVHSSAYGLGAGGSFSEDAMIATAWGFFHRCLGRTLEHEGLIGNVPPEIMGHFVLPSYKPVFEADAELLETLRLERAGEED
jgi:hypothetical protein